jgi:hypothetical protein
MSLPEDIAELAVLFQEVAHRHGLGTFSLYIHAPPNSKRRDRMKVEIGHPLGDLDFRNGRSVAESVCLEDDVTEQIRSMVSGAVHKLKKSYELKAKEQANVMDVASTKRDRALEKLAKVILLDPPVLDKLVQALDES